jgi:hypothetical protein
MVFCEISQLLLYMIEYAELKLTSFLVHISFDAVLPVVTLK